MQEQPTVIKGSTFTDPRGSIRFVNEFGFNNVKRFYVIKHPDISVVRAWQGHKFEKKYFYPISGRFIIVWVKINDFENPAENLIPEYHIISAENSEIVSVPKGYANGLKALEPNSEIMIFSDMTLKESMNDNIRFQPDKWFDWQDLKPL